MISQKRVAAIHDLSGYGRCSLTVALPILSAAGHECACLPTAILSTHTGGYTGFTYRDLTEDMRPFSEHWAREGVRFDAIYSGFLGSFEQIGIVSEFIDRFRAPGTMVLVDPVMADNGMLYKTYTPDMAKGMRLLCEKADIIVPNTTEAAFLLGEGYREGPYTQAYIEKTLHDLAALGPERVVLTGVWLDEPRLGAAAYDRRTGEICYDFSERIEGFFHGTGDVFGSVLLSALLCGRTLAQSIHTAVQFTCASIRRTTQAGTDPRGGVNFEAGLAEFGLALQNNQRA